MADRASYHLPDWNAGTEELSFQEEAVYRKLCDYFTLTDGFLKDDDDLNSRRVKLSKRKYRGIKTALVSAGKIDIVDGWITNARAVKELAKIHKLSAAQREKAEKKARKTREKNAENAAFSERKTAEKTAGETAMSLKKQEQTSAVAGAAEGALSLTRSIRETHSSTPSTELFPETQSTVRTRSGSGKAINATADDWIQPHFDRFWGEFVPHKRAKGHKGDALKEFVKAVNARASPTRIIDQAAAYSAYCAAVDQSSQDAHRWLRKKRWEEDFPVSVSNPSAGFADEIIEEQKRRDRG